MRDQCFIKYDYWQGDDSEERFVGPFVSVDAAKAWADGAWVSTYDPRFSIVSVRVPWFGTMQDNGQIR